jgi:hypothetical protein
LYLTKNAGNLKSLPFLRVDERLLPLVETMATNEFYLTYLLEIAAEIVGGDIVNNFARGSEARHKLVQLLGGLGVQEEDKDDDAQAGAVEEAGALEEPEQVSGAEDLTSLFLGVARTISGKLHRDETALIEIRNTTS